mmetsp:Transcript_22966/g.46634  ORF Transcript_22966/g.46634 Transcript_22966/m.46634 type:complete len:112 (-) Transcript_22966:102-437(-)
MNAYSSTRGLILRNRSGILRHFQRNRSDITSSTTEQNGYKVMGLYHITTKQMRWAQRKKDWLSDPSVYPLLVALGAGMTFATGVGISCLLSNPDVQIDPVRRNKMIRDWTI